MTSGRTPFDPDRVRLPEPSDELDRLAHAVIGAAIEVHRHLGPGFIEAVYEEAMAVEMTLRGTPFVKQEPVAVTFKGHCIGEGVMDFLVDRRLVVELKAVESITPLFVAQTMSYLKATRLQLGLLINFNVPVLKDGIRRIVLN